MKLKDPSLESEWASAPVFLKEIMIDFDRISRRLGIDPVITRILQRIGGSSGVHEDGRALDVRDEYQGKHTYNQTQRDALVNYINARYPRNDGYLTCIHHGFQGGPEHFHIQIARDMLKYIIK